MCMLTSVGCGDLRTPMTQLLPSLELAMWFIWLDAPCCGRVSCKQRQASPQWWQSMWHWVRPRETCLYWRDWWLLEMPMLKFPPSLMSVKITIEPSLWQLFPGSLPRASSLQWSFSSSVSMWRPKAIPKANSISRRSIQLTNLQTQWPKYWWRTSSVPYGQPHGLGPKPSLMDTRISIREGVSKNGTSLVSLISTEKKILDHTLNYLRLHSTLNGSTLTNQKSSNVSVINEVANNHSKSVLLPNPLFGTCLTLLLLSL